MKALTNIAIAVILFASGASSFSTLFTRRSTAIAPSSSSLLPLSASIVDKNSNNNKDAFSSPSPSELQTKKNERKQLIRQEGGRLAFDTPFGALNPFAIYYGLVAIFLGIPWFVALSVYQFFAFITRGKLDRQRYIPILINHLWGTTLMRLTRCNPTFQNRQLLTEFYKQGRPAMFVANHNSWMDIPFMGVAIGWRNYKIIAKKELSKVPILNKAIRVAGNIEVDRSDRKSQLKTLKKGIDYLKNGVNLCTFPEGTRTRTGRLRPFKNGAFKMAHKAGAPVIPMSIIGAANVHPVHWMFPYRPAHNVATVVFHPPVESANISEEELAQRVRTAMISGLPPEQRPEENEMKTKGTNKK